MPVDDGRLGKAISESQLQNIADTRLDYRSGDLTVEAPGLGDNARDELPVDLSSFKVNFNNRPISVWNRGVVRLRVGSKRVTC
jgi:hypothetical protein